MSRLGNHYIEIDEAIHSALSEGYKYASTEFYRYIQIQVPLASEREIDVVYNNGC